MEAIPIDEINLDELKAQIHGKLVIPSDLAYEEERKLYNGMIRKHPRAIVKCSNVADVIYTVNFARSNGFITAIRAGGHNGAGLGSVDGGLVIDMDLMKGIHVDPYRKTVRVEAGCRLADLDHATQVFGMAVPSGTFSTTGVAGLTLGGGIGYLTRKYGLTIDNLIEANMVLADGSYITVNEHEYADLYWAIRGGGGNFGVVTSFLFKMQPVNMVYGGPIFWDLSVAHDVFRFYKDYIRHAPEDMYGFFAFLRMPSVDPFPKALWDKNVCAIVWNYTGALGEAENVFKPIREVAPPLLDASGPIPFIKLQSMFDALYPSGLNWYWKADYINDISEESIEENLKFASCIPTALSQTHIYPVDGYAGKIPKDATAWNYRDAKWVQVIVAVDPELEKMDQASEWCKSYWQALHPHSAGGAYSNFMMEEGDDRVKAAFGENYDRLQKIKTKYDPDNFFRVNQNIKPL